MMVEGQEYIYMIRTLRPTSETKVGCPVIIGIIYECSIIYVPPSIFNMWHFVHPSVLSSLRKLECIHLEYGLAQWELELISWQCYCWYTLCPESYKENQIPPFGSFSAGLFSLHQMENLVCCPDCSSTYSCRSWTFESLSLWRSAGSREYPPEATCIEPFNCNRNSFTFICVGSWWGKTSQIMT